jgi:hypothetical protein
VLASANSTGGRLDRAPNIMAALCLAYDLFVTAGIAATTHPPDAPLPWFITRFKSLVDDLLR